MALIDIYRVCEITKLSRSTIYNKVKSQDFPAPGKVPSPSSRGPRLVNRWDEKEVEYWVENSSDKMIWITRLKEQDTLKAPYGDDFLAEARKSEGFSVFGWDEPETMWKKYSPHIFAIVLIVVVAAIIKFVVL